MVLYFFGSYLDSHVAKVSQVYLPYYFLETQWYSRIPGTWTLTNLLTILLRCSLSLRSRSCAKDVPIRLQFSYQFLEAKYSGLHWNLTNCSFYVFLQYSTLHTLNTSKSSNRIKWITNTLSPILSSWQRKPSLVHMYSPALHPMKQTRY